MLFLLRVNFLQRQHLFTFILIQLLFQVFFNNLNLLGLIFLKLLIFLNLLIRFPLLLRLPLIPVRLQLFPFLRLINLLQLNLIPLKNLAFLTFLQLLLIKLRFLRLILACILHALLPLLRINLNLLLHLVLILKNLHLRKILLHMLLIKKLLRIKPLLRNEPVREKHKQRLVNILRLLLRLNYILNLISQRLSRVFVLPVFQLLHEEDPVLAEDLKRARLILIVDRLLLLLREALPVDNLLDLLEQLRLGLVALIVLHNVPDFVAGVLLEHVLDDFVQTRGKAVEPGGKRLNST